MSDDLIARRLRDLAPAAESGRRPACAQAMREAADALEAAQADTKRWRTRADALADEVARYEDFSNEVVEMAGDEWISDEAQETIAVRYVRWLESERARADRLAALADQLAEALHRELDGFEDEEIGLQTHEALAAWRAARGENPQE